MGGKAIEQQYRFTTKMGSTTIRSGISTGWGQLQLQCGRYAGPLTLPSFLCSFLSPLWCCRYHIRGRYETGHWNTWHYQTRGGTFGSPGDATNAHAGAIGGVEQAWSRSQQHRL